MASIGIMIGGVIINALAFSGSKFLFSSLSKKSIEKERKRHDKAIEDMQQAQIEWIKKDKNNKIMKKHKSREKVYGSKCSNVTVFPSDWQAVRTDVILRKAFEWLFFICENR